MSHYRRYRIAGGGYFFTVNLLERNKSLLLDHVGLLRIRYECVNKNIRFILMRGWCYRSNTYCIWTLPEGDADFSKGLLKDERRSSVRGIWQRRFWEHVIQDD